MGSCSAPSAKGEDKFITTDYLQQCRAGYTVQFPGILAGFFSDDYCKVQPCFLSFLARGTSLHDDVIVLHPIN
jgi:hypothetical protein